MKIEELFEMVPSPQFNDKEMPSLIWGKDVYFASEKTLKSDYFPIKNFTLDEDTKKYSVFLKKNLSKAIIGFINYRDSIDDVGLSIIGWIDFKQDINISFDRVIKYDKTKVLRVDGVEIQDSEKKNGFGFLLYLYLIQAGFIIISDNYQYIGGKEIWKKIIRKSKLNNFVVYVIENGKLMMKDDKIKIIQSDDIENENIFWSEDSSKLYTLFLAKKK